MQRHDSLCEQRQSIFLHRFAQLLKGDDIRVAPDHRGVVVLVDLEPISAAILRRFAGELSLYEATLELCRGTETCDPAPEGNRLLLPELTRQTYSESLNRPRQDLSDSGAGVG